MQYIVIDAEKKEATACQAEGLTQAMAMVGLRPTEVDHGVIAPGIGIVVYEFGLQGDPEEACLWSIGKQLFAGNAVFYGFDVTGADKDIKHLLGVPLPVWYDTYQDVEKAIAMGLIERPTVAFNGEVIWQWPNREDDRNRRSS